MNYEFLFYFVSLILGVFATPPLQINDDPSKFENLFDTSFAWSGLHHAAGVRLSQDIDPLHYDLRIRPIIHLPLDDPQQFTAPGDVTIRLRIVVPTNNITLHADDLIIYGAAVQLINVETSVSVGIISQSNNSAMSTYTIFLAQELPANTEYELSIPFEAKVGDRLSGLYRSSYIDDSGNPRWLATTQFESLGARMAFPCFDEPTFKSTFNITIGRYTGYRSLTNSPLLRTEPMMQNWFWDFHETTVKMSTYLVAIIVSDFVSVDAPQELSNYTVKVWGPPTMTNNSTAQFAATSSAQIVSYFETYLDSTFQFSKLDSAAIPDFAAGAMENWALNTYRLNYLLFNEGESTQNDKFGIARVIAHEISHHWFGDLVTCEWWNDLWLNEGFASYMELLGTAATGFDVDPLERYTVDKIQVAMAFDVGPSSQPVRSNDSDNLSSTPSTIIYQKGSSLIRMMQGFLTEETFITAMRNYLDKHAYDNTVQDQLFESLQAQADLDGTLENVTVKQIMDTWTTQTGFPIVSVTWFPDHVLFRHEIFELNPPHWDDTATQAAGTWYTPIAWTQQSTADFSEASFKPKFWFEPGIQNNSLVLPVADDEWIVANPDARSYFRTIYCGHFLSLIIGQLETDHTAISANSRGQIIDDLFKTVFTNGWENAQMKDALNITKYLNNEDSTAVWITVFNNLKPINSHLLDTLFYGDFSTYLLSKITPVLDRIGWEQNESEAPKTSILRTYLLDWACSLGSPDCSNLAQGYAVKLSTGENVPADLQPIIFCKAMSISDTLDLPGNFSIENFLLEQYAVSTKEERVALFLNSLACVPQSSVQKWITQVTSASSPFSPSQSISFLERLGGNPENVAPITDYFLPNLQRIISVLGETVVSRVVFSMASYTSGFVPRIRIRAVINEAFEIVTNDNVRESLIESNSTLESNIEWVADWGQKIEDWLQ